MLNLVPEDPGTAGPQLLLRKCEQITPSFSLCSESFSGQDAATLSLTRTSGSASIVFSLLSETVLAIDYHKSKGTSRTKSFFATSVCSLLIVRSSSPCSGQQRGVIVNRDSWNEWQVMESTSRAEINPFHFPWLMFYLIIPQRPKCKALVPILMVSGSAVDL